MSHPVASLLKRARSARSPAERHHTAYFACEAALKLAVAARADDLDLTPLARGSTGTWLAFLRAATKVETTALSSAPAFAEAARVAGAIDRQTARRAKGDLFGALGVLVAYRNKVIGHGSYRDGAFYGELSDHLLELGAELAARFDRDPAGLEPLVVVRPHPVLDREQVGFLNAVKSRGGKVRRAEYLDYESGESFDHPDPRSLSSRFAGEGSTDAPTLGLRVRRAIRHYRLPLGLLGLAAFTTVGFAAWQWDQTRVKTYYHHDYHVTSAGFSPVGEPIAGGHLRPYAKAWAFDYVGGRVVRMHWPLGFSEPGEWAGWDHSHLAKLGLDEPGYVPPHAIEHTYTDGRLTQLTWRGPGGGGVYRAEVESISENEALWRHYDADGIARAVANGTPPVLRLTFDEAGREIERAHLDIDLNPHQIFQWLGGKRTERDDRGRRIQLVGLDLQMTPIPLKRVRRHFDDPAHPWLPSEVSWWMPDGKRTTAATGVFSEKLTYDPNGALLRVDLFDRSGSPLRKRRPDDGENASPIRAWTRPEGCASRAFRYDTLGRVVEAACLGADGQPRDDVTGVQKETLTWEGACPVEIAHFDATGERADSTIAIQRTQCDDRGLYLTSTDVAGDGISGATTSAVRDQAGRIVAMQATTLDGKPAELLPDVTSLERVYSAGTVVQHLEGWRGKPDFRMEHRYRSDRTEIRYFHPDGEPAWRLNPARTNVGVSHGVNIIIADGLMRTDAIDTSGSRVRGQVQDNSIAMKQRITTLNGDGTPNDASGHATLEHIYDANSRVVSTRHFDAADRPTRSDYGFFEAVRAHSDNGLLTDERYFEVDGQPTADRRKGPDAHHLRRSYNDDGDIVGQATFGVEEQPVAVPILGTHRDELTRSPAGRVIGQAAYDVDGNLVYRGSWIYDERGRMIHQILLDPDGAPLKMPRGVPETTWIFDDEAGTETLLRLDGHGQMLGYGMEYTRDATGAVVRVRHLDETRTPAFATVPTNSEVAREVYNPLIDEAVADGLPSPFQAIYRQCEVRLQRDSAGRITELTHYGPTGEPATPEPFTELPPVHRIVFERDEQGKVIRRTHFGQYGEAIADSSGAFRIESKRDRRGRVVEISLHAPDGALVDGPDGWAMQRTAWDLENRVVSQTLTRADGTAVEDATR